MKSNGNGNGVHCLRCGQEWPRDPALEVACPLCRAPVGRACRRPSQHEVYGGAVHSARDQAALDAGFVQMCPKGESAAAGRGQQEEAQQLLFLRDCENK